MIEVLACIGFAAGIYSVWMSLANKKEAQRLRNVIHEAERRTDGLEDLVFDLKQNDEQTRNELAGLCVDIKNIGVTSRRLDGDLQELRGFVRLVSQDVKELQLNTDRTSADMQRFKSAMLEGSKVADKWFAGDA